MSKLIFDRGNFSDFTSVSNIFIDEFMPKANGEFTKIYLYLLRLVNTGCEDISFSKIADKFNMLESDVMRALNYWSEQNLISLSFDSSYNITGIKLEPLNGSRYFVKGILNNDCSQNSNIEMLATASGESVPSAIPSSEGLIIPTKKKYSAKEIAAFSNDERLSQLTFLAETYLGKTLSSSDINSIIYMLNDLNLESDFIEYILETCISNGKKNLSCVEKQAVEYIKHDIHTISEAKSDLKLRRAICKSIYGIFGLEAKTPIKKELDYITKWTNELGFNDNIILEACHRTMEHTHSASFKYTDSILLNWFGNNVTSLEDIEKLDSIHSEENKEKYSTKNNSVRTTKTKKEKSFDQRKYDYDQLEKKVNGVS